MSNFTFTRRAFVAFLGLFFLVGCANAPLEKSSEDNSTLIYLVRHAEKLDGRDPSLTPEGQARAQALVTVLKEAGISQIFSTNYKRTQETAAPLASALGLTVEPYNPGALSDFAGELKAMTGHILVVGHSNTTPALVEILGGEPGTPIFEKSEYDRLYIVTIKADGSVSSELQRYGAPYTP